MTDIKIYRKDNFIVGFECKNHSGFAKYGKDIVCAGISCITQTAILGIQNIANANCNVTIDENLGYLKLEIVEKDKNLQTFKDTQIILRTMLCGLEDLQRQYPKYMKLEDK